MKQILVTGLDGSGKSTFFSRLAMLDAPHQKILLVPHIDTGMFVNNPALCNAATFINTISTRADKEQLPFLKAIAFFCSMVIFKDLLFALTTPDVRFVFCERHPLIDTGIYARFYASKLQPEGLPQEIMKQTDDAFPEALRFILDKLPALPFDETTGATGRICNFIYDWFHAGKKSGIADLKKLFRIEAPSKIYFLEAPAAILFARIKDRKNPEPHENEAVLEMLDRAYGGLLKHIQENNICPVEMVDASATGALDIFFATIQQAYFTDLTT